MKAYNIVIMYKNGSSIIEQTTAQVYFRKLNHYINNKAIVIFDKKDNTIFYDIDIQCHVYFSIIEI